MRRDAVERAELIEALVAGDVTLRDLGGLNQRDVASIAHLARVAFESKRYGRAATLFAGLEALEADRPEHALNRAYAESHAARVDGALASVTRYIDSELPRSPSDLVRGLVLRATLQAETDARAAALDLRAADLLAETSPEAKAVLAGGGR